MFGYQTSQLDARLLPESWCLHGHGTLCSVVSARPSGCTCKLGHYWRFGLIDTKIATGQSDKYGQVLCPTCADPRGG